jgi:hypothetical protein
MGFVHFKVVESTYCTSCPEDVRYTKKRQRMIELKCDSWEYNEAPFCRRCILRMLWKLLFAEVDVIPISVPKGVKMKRTEAV